MSENNSLLKVSAGRKGVKFEIDLDKSADAAYVSYKERHSPSTKYIDEKRKSFPIRKGHECTDLEAATKAFGRYKGSMTHDAFVSKVKRLMKEHSCPIPKAWEDKKD